MQFGQTGQMKVNAVIGDGVYVQVLIKNLW